MATVITAQLGGVNIGGLDLSRINYSAQELAGKLAGFVAHGSLLHILAPSDIRIEKSPADTVPSPITFEWLISKGNRFFDCLFYLSLPEDKRPAMVSVPDGSRPAPLTGQQVASALFVQYFFILTRGSPSESTSTNVGTDIPNFLRNILGLNEAPETYARRLASFHLNKIDPSWVKYVPFGDLGREAVNRLGLGVAGYRSLSPFKLLTPKADMDPTLQPALDFARSMATAAYSWDIHPSTRNPNIMTTYGPLNKNLGNLALECFTTEQLTALVVTRAIFALPVHSASHTQYKTWSGVYNPPPPTLIFPTT